MGSNCKQQIVAERANQSQSRILRMAELFNQRPQHRKRRRLLAAFFFGEASFEWSQRKRHRALRELAAADVRVAIEQRPQYLK